MENNFRIRNDFILRYRRRNYTYQDIAQAVSYWLDQINQTTGTIGIAYATLSFSSIAFLLALYKSQRPFTHLGVIGKEVTVELLDNQKLGSIFVVGDLFQSNIKLDFISHQLHHTDTWDHAYNCSKWLGAEELVIPFTDTQIINAYTSGSTGKPSAVSMTSYIESLSIQLAMDSFFVDDDYCVFAHGMSHMGVHTTAILPGLFKARVVSLADYTWAEEMSHATHVQFFSTMSFLELPKRLRVITTGGNSLKSTFLEQIQSQCQVENIYDIYGLTECLPPLAVRSIQSIADLNKPFTWVNTAYQVEIQNDRIKITRPDDVVFVTSDRGSLINNQLTFLGRALNMIRLYGNLVSVEEFKQTFEASTKILDYAIEYNNEFILHVLESDTEAVTLFVQVSNANVFVKYHRTLDTNGGIKNIS
jgi:acyl-CoA synthetase (AMP-forming)/AMP-acid ligase II